MSNSSLVSYTNISPNKTSPRKHIIDTITIHCVVGQLSAEGIASCFTEPSARASCNYGIGKDGRIALIVEEKDRSWCSSNAANDNRAITIECASDMEHPYAINDAVYQSLIELCADICKRNNIKELKWKADKSLIGHPEEQNMTVHRWFANKACPGDYIYERLGQIAKEVNAKLNVSESSCDSEKTENSIISIKKGDLVSIISDAKYYNGADIPNWVKAKKWYVLEVYGDRAVIDKSEDGANAIESPINVKYLRIEDEKSDLPYLVKVDITNLNIRKGPGTNYSRTGSFTGKGVFTIVEVKDGEGSNSGWGRLKSGAGWICLDYTNRV